MRFSNLLVSAFISGALFSACTTDEITIPKSELYAREFIKKFGVIDPNRDLNAARHAGINIVTTSPTDVKVYADVDGKRYLFAKGRNINGNATLKFDIPASVKEVIVDAGGEVTVAAVGSTVRVNGVSRKASRTDWTQNSNFVTGVLSPEDDIITSAELCTEKKDWMVVPMLNATIFRRKMPEGCYNSSREGVENDFMMKFKKKDIVIRPLFWQTNQDLTFGLFYLDSEGKPVHCPIYGMEKNTENEPAPVDNLALCWVPSNTKSITIKDFMNNEVFMDCLAKQGISVIDRKANNGVDYRYISVYSLDNFLRTTTSDCDRDMTRACCEYLESIGIKNDPNADPDQRYNYVYRWRMTGDAIRGNNQWGQEEDLYDDSFITNGYKCPRKDLEIVYTYYNYDYENLAKGWSGNNDMTADIKMDDENYPSLISKGIKVHLEDIDRAYGGYIKDGDKYFYSYSPLNEGIRWVPGPGAERTESYFDYYTGVNIMRFPESAFVKDPLRKAFRAVTWIGTKYNWRYMSFEDGQIGDTYSRGSCDFDMQDFVFILDDETEVYHDPVDSIINPEDPEPEVYKWLIAAEDLAGTYDWDFNDAVFAVSATSIVDGDNNNACQTWITVEPLAAGGTLPIYVMFNGDIVDEKGNAHGIGHYHVGPELHRWLGGYYRTPINVREPVASATGIPLSFHVDGEWSLTDEYHNRHDWQEKDVKGMGGFYILVNPGNSLNYMQMDISKFMGDLGDENHFHMVTPPSSFDKQDQVVVSPEMLCVENSWCWPMEERGIHDVYAQFEDWLHGKAQSWYSADDFYDKSSVVSHK